MDECKPLGSGEDDGSGSDDEAAGGAGGEDGGYDDDQRTLLSVGSVGAGGFDFAAAAAAVLPGGSSFAGLGAGGIQSNEAAGRGGQGLTLVHIFAQPDPCLSQKTAQHHTTWDRKCSR